MMAASSFSGGEFLGTPGPNRPQPAGKCLRCHVARTREREDLTSLKPRDLRHDMRGGPESVEPEALRVARLSQ